MSTAEATIVAAAESAERHTFRAQIGHISRQSTIFFAGTIFTAAAGYFFKVYLARVLGAEALGVYALGMTIIGFLGIFNALGLPQSAVRFVAEYSATGEFGLLRGFLVRSLGWLTISNVVLAVLVLLAGPWIAEHLYHTPSLKTFMGLFAVIMIVGALNTFLGQVLAGYKDVARRTLITNFLGSPLTMIFTLGAFAIGWGLGGYIFAQAIAALVVMGFLFWSAWKLTPTPVKRMHSGFPSMESEVISFSAVTFGIAFLEFVIAQADKIIIGFYLNAREVGIYALAATLIGFLPIVLQSVNQIFCPTIAELHARNEHDLLEKIYQTLTKWIVGLTIPLAAVMIVFAPGLMQLFGKEFAGAWPVLVIGTAGQLINCSVGSVGYLLLMSGNQRKLITIQAISGIVMVVLNVKLVPNLGIIGAAIAAATANAFTNLACLLQVRKTLKMFPFRRSYLRLFPSTLASVGTLLLLRVTLDGRLTDGLAIVIGVACAYLVFATVSLLFGLDENDRVIAHAAWAKLSGNLPRMMGASQ